MPRVVLVATDPDLQVSELTAPLADWEGGRLTVVLVSLHGVPDLEALDPSGGWPASPDRAGGPTLRGWTYREPPAPAGPRAGSARARRLQDEAAAQQRGRRLWELASQDAALGPLLDAADAIVATDLGGIRSAFHLARRHGIEVATSALVPCLVELAARASAEQPQSWDDSGGASEPVRPL